MWMPVCGPFPEFHIGTGGEDDLPVPAVGRADRAGGLADVRRGRRVPPYGEQPLRVWGLSVTDDQQLAGAIMKTGGSIFLWTIIVTLWFTRFSRELPPRARLPAPARSMPPGRDRRRHADDRSTYDDVEREFASVPRRRTAHAPLTTAGSVAAL